MLLEPVSDAPLTHAPDPWTGWQREVAMADQLERFVRAARGGVQPQHRAGASLRPRHLREVVRRTRGAAAAVERGDGGGIRRRHGRRQGAGDGAPLRHQHRHRAPGHRLREDDRKPAWAARAQAHAPAQGTPPGGSRLRRGMRSSRRW